MQTSIVVVSSALLACSSVFVATACSSSSSDSSPRTEGDAGAPEAGAGSTFTAYVAEPTAPQIDAPWRALPGASAFLDTASGARIEATADAAGRVIFEGVDFSAGPATLTAYAAGHVIFSFANVTPENVAKMPSFEAVFPQGAKDLVVMLEPSDPPPPEAVEISGAIAGKLDAANTVTIGGINALGVFQDDSAAYSLAVRKDAPLTLVALEWSGGAAEGGWNETKHRWLTIDVPAKAANGTVDLDLATFTPATPTKVSVTLVASATTSDAPPGWQVFTREPGPFLGSRSVVTSSDQKTFKADGEYIAAPGGAPVATSYYFPAMNGATAFVQHGGFPTEGATITALALPKTPPASTIGGSVALNGIDPSAEIAGIEVVDRTKNDALRWIVASLRGSPVPASITLPDLPDAARAMLPAAPKGRVLALAGSFDAEHPWVVGKGAFSTFFDVRK